VIGHEISHGFDDQGSQYDGDGNLRDWWTAGQTRDFAAKTKRWSRSTALRAGARLPRSTAS
jgi:predicted metalloendopeptidase